MKRLITAFSLSLLFAAPVMALPSFSMPSWQSVQDYVLGSAKVDPVKVVEQAEEFCECPLPQVKPVAPTLVEKLSGCLPASRNGKIALGVATAGVVGAAGYATYRYMGGLQGIKQKLFKKDQPDAAKAALVTELKAKLATKGTDAKTAQWRFVPSARTLVGAGVTTLTAAGLAAAYWKGYLSNVDGKALVDATMNFGKNHWQALAGAATATTVGGAGVSAYPTVSRKATKWWSTRRFMKALTAKIEAGEEITLDWVKECAPVTVRRPNGAIMTGFESFLKGFGSDKGFIELVNTYRVTQDANEKARLKAAIDEKIQVLSRYLGNK